MKTVGELKTFLADLPDDLPIGLCVYNHSWYSNCHSQTHGECFADVGVFHNNQEIAIIYQGRDGWPRDGYELRKVKL